MEDKDPPVSPRGVRPAGLTKSRSFSDPPTAPPTLAPSPTIRERRTSKDDCAVPTTPKVIRRPDFINGLSLQLPREMLSPAQLRAPTPLSPQLDSHNIHAVQAGSPITSLPRHSRGLDFSRASTNLHHSTLAEQSSPDLSPIITQRGVTIPSRKMSTSSMALDSPNVGGLWSSLGQGRSAVSSSVGSVNMLASDSESTSSEDDASMDENDDPIFTTPQVHKLHNHSAPTPFNTHAIEASVFGDSSAQSPAAASLLRTIRKSRLNKSSNRRTTKSSSSASNSGYSSIASPRASSPPPVKSIEGVGPAYFGRPKSRRESLALGTDSLHLSSGNDSGDEGTNPGVVRRPVTRRGNLLPKTKGFARIRATLAEEASPMDTDTRREAETIRQVRERDSSMTKIDRLPTAPSSPALLPAVPELAQCDFGRELDPEATPMSKGVGVNFQLHATRSRLDSFAGSPPPALSRQSSTLTSDAMVDSPSLAPHDAFQRVRGRAHSNASDISEVMAQLNGPAACMNDDMHIKKLKRRRDDDFDIATVKRRAVSPGMSSQNSPVLTQSPYQREGNWGHPPERKKEITSAGADANVAAQLPLPTRSSSNGSAGTPTTLGQGKKLGQKGMADTNDGLMKMSIE